jgi:hypothetical protein
VANDFTQLLRDQTPAIFVGDLLQLQQYTKQLLQHATYVQAKMRHMFDDQVNPIDWSTIETLFGVPTGKGQTVYTWVDGLQGSLQGLFQTDAGKQIVESMG